MTKRLILAYLIGLVFCLSARDVLACSCVKPEVSQAFREARAVFAGEVIDILEPRSNMVDAPLAERLYVIKFKVEKLWKGAETEEIVVLSDQGRAGCFSWSAFAKGKKYLVYAERRTPSGATTNDLVVLFSCNRTALIENAAPDLKILQTMKFRSPSKNGTKDGGRS